MKAYMRRIGGLTLAARADSNHWVTLDSSLENGGQGAGSSPMELILMGLGGCMSMDVLSILAKKRVLLEDYEVRLEAERAGEHPRIFTRINIKFTLYGEGIPPEAVARAIQLSEEKYCSASAMLVKSAAITSEFEILPASDRPR